MFYSFGYGEININNITCIEKRENENGKHIVHLLGGDSISISPVEYAEFTNKIKKLDMVLNYLEKPETNLLSDAIRKS